MILFFATFLERDEKLFSAIPKKGFWEMILSISNDNKNIGSRSNEVILVGSNDIRPTGFISFFQKWAIPGLFFLYFRLFNTQLTVNKCSINFSRLLDSNHGPMVLEATALPTEPQPLPTGFISYFIQRSPFLNVFLCWDKKGWTMTASYLSTNNKTDVYLPTSWPIILKSANGSNKVSENTHLCKVWYGRPPVLQFWIQPNK